MVILGRPLSQERRTKMSRMKEEYFRRLDYASECCEAPPFDQIDESSGLGFCSKCKDNAVFSLPTKVSSHRLCVCPHCGHSIRVDESEADDELEW